MSTLTDNELRQLRWLLRLWLRRLGREVVSIDEIMAAGGPLRDALNALCDTTFTKEHVVDMLTAVERVPVHHLELRCTGGDYWQVVDVGRCKIRELEVLAARRLGEQSR